MPRDIMHSEPTLTDLENGEMMEKYVVLIVVGVGLVGLFGLVNFAQITGMASQPHMFFAENICGQPGMVPLIAKTAVPSRGGQNLIYGCIPEGEKIMVQSSKFRFDEREKEQSKEKVVKIFSIHRIPIRG